MTFGTAARPASFAWSRTSGWVFTVRSGRRSEATVALIERFISVGRANRPIPATAKARVATVKTVRDLRRLRSVTALRVGAENIDASSRADAKAVADGYDPAS